jgi:hypothetical protein
LPEIPPVLPFSKGGELSGIRWSNSFHFFPLWKRGMKGDLTAFQKAKRLQDFMKQFGLCLSVFIRIQKCLLVLEFFE